MTVVYSLLPYIQIAASILLISAILLQMNEASLGAAFGGGDSFGGGSRSRRGFEKVLFNTTIVLAIIFAVAAFAALL